MRRWDRQNNTLSKIQKEIEKTQTAIEREGDGIGCIDRNRSSVSEEIQKFINDGILKQWGRYSHTTFVEGVDRACIIWDDRERVVMYRFMSPIADTEQRKKSARAYNLPNVSIDEETGKQREK